MSKEKESFILIEFKDNNTSFDVNVDNDVQLIMAIAGLEGYLAAQTGLSKTEVRELVDDAMSGATVKPKVKDEKNKKEK